MASHAIDDGTLARAGALAACLLLMVACGESGTEAVRETTGSSPSASPARPVVSPPLLDPGKYPTSPRPPLGMSRNPGIGAIVDAQHLADFAAGPWEVDDALVDTYLNSYYVVATADVLQQLGPEEIAAAAGRSGLINGFASARQHADTAATVNAVLRFPDPAAAVAASAAMGDAAVKRPVKGVVPTAVPIPGHPDAVASTYPFTPHGSNQPRATVRSFTPSGPYVLMQFVQSAEGLDPATALVAKAIDTQRPVLDGFTPAGDLAAMPLDPTGLLAKTLPAANAATAKNAVYGVRGAEHFQSNPVGSATLFDDTGTTRVTMGSTNVYEAKDDGAAVLITNAFSDEVASSDGAAPADTVTPLPDSHCYALPQAF